MIATLLVASCSSSDDSGAGNDAPSAPPPSTGQPTDTSSETTPPPVTSAPEATATPVETTEPPAALTPRPRPPAGDPSPSGTEFATFEWQTVNPDARWAARAGLRVVELGGRLLLLGGRTPNQSTIVGWLR